MFWEVDPASLEAMGGTYYQVPHPLRAHQEPLAPNVQVIWVVGLLIRLDGCFQGVQYL